MPWFAADKVVGDRAVARHGAPYCSTYLLCTLLQVISDTVYMACWHISDARQAASLKQGGHNALICTPAVRDGCRLA